MIKISHEAAGSTRNNKEYNLYTELVGFRIRLGDYLYYEKELIQWTGKIQEPGTRTDLYLRQD